MQTDRYTGQRRIKLGSRKTNITDDFSGSYRDLSPDKSAQRDIFSSSGADRVAIRPKPKVRAKDESNKNNGSIDQEPSTRVRRQHHRRPNQEARTNEQSRRGSIRQSKGRQAGNKTTSSIKGLGNQVKNNKGVIFWATTGDLLDFVPGIGFILNWVCAVVVWFMFKSQGIDFLGRATKGSGLANVLLELIISPLFFWPGLLIGTLQTLNSQGK